MYILAQITGVLAVLTFVFSYQFKRRIHIIIVNATSSVLYVLQYLMLGAFEGAMIDFISSVSTILAGKKDNKFIKKYLVLVIILLNLSFIISGLILYKNIFSLFPIVGAILQSSAFWITEERKIRLVSFLASPFWLVYNFVSQAYAPVIGSLMSLVSIGIAIIRYDILKSKENKS